MPTLSIVIPAYNEAANLPVLYERISATMEKAGLGWECIVVDDHSSDDTFAVLTELAQRTDQVKAIRLARNQGSHLAIACGLHYAKGDCAVVLAADLQDPPELIPQLLAEWQSGGQVVWMARRRREGESLSTIGFSRLYHFMMRHIVGIRDMPARGADFFLLDRRVVETLRDFHENNFSIMALITWVGFRQRFLVYDKQARLHGRSNWTFWKKIKLALDSIMSFTYLPIRAVSALGFLVALGGFLSALEVIIHYFAGHPVEGWSSLMIVLLMLGGIQMIIMGVLGEYLWRALDEARRRPRYIIEETRGAI